MKTAVDLGVRTHVVDILGNVVGRDQPIMLMAKAIELVTTLDEDVFHSQDVVFFDPFCKAGEILLACAYASCCAKFKTDVMDIGSEKVEIAVKNELYHSNRYFALSPDERHHRLSLRTFLGNENSHKKEFNHIIRNGNYVSEIDGRLDREKFEREFLSMLEYIKNTSGKKKIIAVGNPPYQESDGGGTGKSAIPIYNIFVEKLIGTADVREFVIVIPSRWFAGGKGLNSFRENLIKSKKISTIANYSNSSTVFPTVDINGGVCFLHYNKGEKSKNIKFLDNETSHSINLDGLDIIPDDPRATIIYKHIKSLWKGKWVSDTAMARNAFGIPSNLFKNNTEKTRSSGEKIQCFFMGKRVRFLNPSLITNNADLIKKYKVVVSKAAGGSKGKRRSTIPVSVFFILNPGEVCSETYSIVDVFSTVTDAERFCAFLKTDFARYLVGIRKITQNVSRDSWKWVPHIGVEKEWIDCDLFEYFKITPEEQKHIKNKVKEWS
ncbi:MAG: Eco57I restriction-modification methylase domain-containing protein [Gammaproteobacteria bacterium]|nr:Eco57I restriction-modification methylase domain-containing protein [Gammaproteobacteria bacterium]